MGQFCCRLLCLLCRRKLERRGITPDQAPQCRSPVQRFSDAAQTQLLAHRWPGNLRELRNAIERAVILSSGKEIEAEDLPGTNGEDGSHASHSDGLVGSMISLEKLEAAHIRKVLDLTPSLIEATRVLGIDQATLYRKRKKLGMV